MMVAFFPWMAVEEELDLGEFALVPYRRGTLPAGRDSPHPDPALQGRLDALFEHFHESHGIRINVATVVRVGGHALTDELTDEERGDVFVASELVTLCGLSVRQLFGLLGLGLGYNSADTFQFYIQGFRDAPGGAGISTRRRDGAALAYVTADAYHVYAPPHVRAQQDTRIDAPLVRALLNARNSGDWERLEEAAVWFNRANTDSDRTSEQTEAVMVVGAFARLFGLDGPRIEAALTPLLVDALKPVRQRLASDAPRGIPPAIAGPGVSVREAWIRDLVRVRHQPAHGRLQLRESAWPVREHLLLASVAFPLAMKAVLSRPPFGLYVLTEDDLTSIEMFEMLASEDAFAHEREPEEGVRVIDPRLRPRPAWPRIRLEYVQEEARRRLEAYAAAHGIRLVDGLLDRNDAES
jgi:hypothetical protein